MEDHNKLTPNATDHLANERTFLAWIRTSIAIMGFGFVVVKFAVFIKQISLAVTDKPLVLPGKGYSTEIGILFVVVGIFAAFYSYRRYRITEKQLIDRAYRPSFLSALLLTIFMVVAGVCLVIYLIPGLL